MSLQYVIDGYNLLRHNLCKSFRKKIKNSPVALLDFIKTKKLCGSSKNKIIIVFDGYPCAGISREVYTNAEIIFSKDYTADERIKKIIKNADNPKNIVVVSDDREIKFFVKLEGAKILSIEEFIQPLSLSKSKVKEAEAEKLEISYTEIHKINQELRKLWLK